MLAEAVSGSGEAPAVPAAEAADSTPAVAAADTAAAGVHRGPGMVPSAVQAAAAFSSSLQGQEPQSRL